jgi:energy-coupling factor transport system permease protein
MSTIVVPVLTDALDRSLALAAAMDSRGYGRRAHLPRRTRRAASALVLAGVGGACVGTYGLLDSTVPRVLGLPMLAAGAVSAVVGLAFAGRRIERSTYRPDPWTVEEWAVAACGVAVAAALVVAGSVDPVALTPPLQPLGWPRLAVLPVAGLLVGALPALLAPPVERRSAGRWAATRVEPAGSTG